MDIPDLQKTFKGEISTDSAVLDGASRDASLFEMRPKMVVYPTDSTDVQALVKWVNTHKAEDPTLSITVRAAGTCMSGGPLNESIIMDTTRHMAGRNTRTKSPAASSIVSPKTRRRWYATV